MNNKNRIIEYSVALGVGVILTTTGIATNNLSSTAVGLVLSAIFVWLLAKNK